MSDTELTPLAWLRKNDHGKEITVSESVLRGEQPKWVQDSWGTAPDLIGLCSLTAAQEAIARLEAERDAATLEVQGARHLAEAARAELAELRKTLEAVQKREGDFRAALEQISEDDDAWTAEGLRWLALSALEDAADAASGKGSQ